MGHEERLESPRLLIRPCHLKDADALFRYRADPEVMKFLPSGADKSLENTRRVIQRYIDHQRQYGFSKWVLVLKSTQRIIGDAGLLFLEEVSGFELGYRIAPERWSNGFATEAGRTWLNAAFSRFGLTRVFAFAHPDNVASIRVLAKLGMKIERRGRFYGMESVLYSTDREAFARRKWRDVTPT